MSEPNTTRRGFVQGFAFGAIAAGSAAQADDAPKDAKPPEKPQLSQVDARMALIVDRFGKHKELDDKALDAIRAEVATIVRRGEQLRKISLENGDGPFPVFHPYRSSTD